MGGGLTTPSGVVRVSFRRATARLSAREDTVIDHEAREALPSITPEEDQAVAESVIERPIHVPHVWGEVRALVRDLIFAALTAVLLVVFVIQPVKVEGTSMLPRLHDG